MSLTNPTNHTLYAALPFEAVKAQLQKDFWLSAIQVDLEASDFKALHLELASVLLSLYHKQYRLIRPLLYRVDLTENKVVEVLQSHPNNNQLAFEALAQIILERTCQRVMIKQKFSNGS